MVSYYPAYIDSSSTLPPIKDGQPISASLVEKLRETIIAIEHELGVKPSGTFGTVRARLDALEKATHQLPTQYEINFVSNIFTTTSSIFVRGGARQFDITNFPPTSGALTRVVKFIANIDKTVGASNVEVQLFDITHGIVVAGTNLTSTNNSNSPVTATLVVGPSNGNLRNDVPTQYELQIKKNGGSGADAVFVTNARFEITYV